MPTSYYFLQHAERGPTGKGVRFRSQVKRAMENYEWPGNCRELKYFSESLLCKSNQSLIEIDDLPHHIRTHTPLSSPRRGTLLRDYLQEAEKLAIHNALAETGGNKSQAAAQLGIHRTLLYRKMRKLDL